MTIMLNEIRIIFVDDSLLDVPLMVFEIEKIGYTVVWARVETEGALHLTLQKEFWDIIVCDYYLPSLTAHQVLDLLQIINPTIPLIVVSGIVDEQMALPLINKGAVDFISKDRLFRLPLAIRRELNYRTQDTKNRMMIDQSFNAIITAWGTALELRDPNTRGHTLRTADHAIKIATRNNLPPHILRNVYFGALLHDVGKIGIPDRILNKPGKLTKEETDIMMTHSDIGYKFLSEIPFLKEAALVPYCHHEYWDGSGYPRGLKGEEIPICARVFTLADVYDSLLSDRPYRKAMPHPDAIQAMREMESRFDPVLFHDFMETEGDETYGNPKP